MKSLVALAKLSLADSFAQRNHEIFRFLCFSAMNLLTLAC
jgi:hypothetical protein